MNATNRSEATRVSEVSSKIRPWHHDRAAIVYVRQSSPHQVAENRESTERQYNLVDRAVALGWLREHVIVIDDDQGMSGSSAHGRPGFQRALAEIGLNHVGLILGLEMSRLARSCKDWYQLLELCGIFRTLLADADGVYDPTDFNDRLVLGLKGTMSEAELHVLKGRMTAGRLNKARRGELFNNAPIGYVRLPTGEHVLDPDEQVQAVVRLIFDQFDRLGSVRQLCHYLVEHDVRIGIRPHTGPTPGQVEWRLPNRSSLLNLLHHPIYAGDYRYGLRTFDPRKKVPGRPFTGRVRTKDGERLILLEGRLPAYITRERFHANQQRLTDNRARYECKGAPRNGPALAAGLLVCGRCGRRMSVQYSGKTQSLRYNCRGPDTGGREPICQSLSGRTLDRLVTDEVLAALRPSALALSLAAIDDVQKERDRLSQLWEQRRERARYQAERAERQYSAVEPENRLVARTLEKQWEESLRAQRQLEVEYEQFRRAQPAVLTAEERKAILALAQDLPQLWNATTTTPADHQRILRQIVARVTVELDKQSNRGTAAIEWVGGCVTQHEFYRSVVKYEKTADFDRLLARMRELIRTGRGPTQTAAILTAEGFRAAYPWQPIGDHTVLMLLRRYGPQSLVKQWQAGRIGLAPHEWRVAGLAKKLRVSRATIWRWAKAGWVRSHPISSRRDRLICWADADELTRLRKLRDHRKNCHDEVPTELKTPKNIEDNRNQ